MGLTRGFIGHHLARRLKRDSHWVRGVDLVRPSYEKSPCDEFLTLDLRDRDASLATADGVEEIYALAANMGGMGFIADNHAVILRGQPLN